MGFTATVLKSHYVCMESRVFSSELMLAQKSANMFSTGNITITSAFVMMRFKLMVAQELNVYEVLYLASLITLSRQNAKIVSINVSKHYASLAHVVAPLLQ